MSEEQQVRELMKHLQDEGQPQRQDADSASTRGTNHTSHITQELPGAVEQQAGDAADKMQEAAQEHAGAASALEKQAAESIQAAAEKSQAAALQHAAAVSALETQLSKAAVFRR